MLASMSKSIVLAVSLFLFTAALVSAAVVPPGINLPTFPVQATYTWDQNAEQFSSIVLSGVGTGYDVSDNKPYIGWCVERLSGPDPAGGTFSVHLYSTLDPAMPANLTLWGTRVIPWDQINYLLNHKQNASTNDVARAIWDLIEGTFSSLPIEQDAIANGTGFVPGPNQILAVILTNGSGINSTGDSWQESIIEVKMPGTTAVTLSSFSARADAAPESLAVGLGALGILLFGSLAFVFARRQPNKRPLTNSNPKLTFLTSFPQPRLMRRE